MKSRRDFFKELIGHIAVAADELKGIRHVPLNKLNELPDSTIEQIEPVFFKDREWYIDEGILVIRNDNEPDESTSLSEIELKILDIFERHTSLKKSAELVSRDTKEPFDEVYEIVTSLFFRLASLRLCHPREII